MAQTYFTDNKACNWTWCCGWAVKSNWRVWLSHLVSPALGWLQTVMGPCKIWRDSETAYSIQTCLAAGYRSIQQVSFLKVLYFLTALKLRTHRPRQRPFKWPLPTKGLCKCAPAFKTLMEHLHKVLQLFLGSAYKTRGHEVSVATLLKQLAYFFNLILGLIMLEYIFWVSFWSNTYFLGYGFIFFPNIFFPFFSWDKISLQKVLF